MKRNNREQSCPISFVFVLNMKQYNREVKHQKEPADVMEQLRLVELTMEHLESICKAHHHVIMQPT